MSRHGRKYWIKLYIETLNDPKILLLPDAAKWRWVSVLLMAGQEDADGFLPSHDHAAVTCRIPLETFHSEMRMLAGQGLVELSEHPDGGERWYVTKYAERQAPSETAERMRQYRQRKKEESSKEERKKAEPDKEQRQTTNNIPNRNARYEGVTKSNGSESVVVAVDILDAFTRNGITLNKKTTELARQAWITPEYIDAVCAFHAERGGVPGGAIQLMEAAFEPPRPRDPYAIPDDLKDVILH